MRDGLEPFRASTNVGAVSALGQALAPPFPAQHIAHSPLRGATPVASLPPAAARRDTRRPRTSASTAPLLAWLAVHRAATIHQVLSLWHSDARDPRHGWRVIGRMVGDGLLSSRPPLDPEPGAVSRGVLTIGPVGRTSRRAGDTLIRGPSPASGSRSVCSGRTSPCCLAPRGGSGISRRDVFSAVRESGLCSYRCRALNGTDLSCRRRLENFLPAPLPCDAIAQDSTG